MTAVLEVDAIEKRFGGVQAVAGLSFSVAAGEMLALIGPNGAGKTTAFNILGGQLRPDAGRVRIGETDITGYDARAIWRLGVGRTFQVTATFASMTVRENLQTAFAARAGRTWRPFGRARDYAADEADALLDQVSLRPQAGRAAGSLAYGDLKRLELALALVGKPRLLLMDEPTAGMGAAERTALMALTRKLATERNIAVLFTEHDMNAVFGVADRVAVMAGGKLIAVGTAADIRANAAVRESYLGHAA